ncbi:hypothetical protein AgCh_031954 [Apium graveolens]
MAEYVVETNLFDESPDRNTVVFEETMSEDEMCSANSVGEDVSEKFTDSFDDSVVMDSLLINQNSSSVMQYVENFMNVKNKVEFIFKREFDDDLISYCFVEGLKEEL